MLISTTLFNLFNHFLVIFRECFYSCMRRLKESVFFLLFRTHLHVLHCLNVRKVIVSVGWRKRGSRGRCCHVYVLVMTCHPVVDRSCSSFPECASCEHTPAKFNAINVVLHASQWHGFSKWVFRTVVTLEYFQVATLGLWSSGQVVTLTSVPSSHRTSNDIVPWS